MPIHSDPTLKCNNSTITLNSNATVTIFSQVTTSQGLYFTNTGLASVIDSDVPASFRILFETGERIFSFYLYPLKKG